MSGWGQDLRLNCRPIQFHDEGKVVVVAEFFETEMPVEALGAFVCGTNAKMDRRHAVARKLVEHGLDHQASPPTRLGLRQNIDMKMRRVGRFKTRRSAMRVGDSLQNIGVFCNARCQASDLPPNKRPPVSVERFIEACSIRRTDNIAYDPLVFGENERKIRSKFEIRHGPHITGKARIAVKRARVGSGVSRHQANMEEGVNVVLVGRTDETIVDLRRHGIIDLLAAARCELMSGGGKTEKVEGLHLRAQSPQTFWKE